MARQRLDFLIVILELVLVSQRDVSVRVPGHDCETASIEAAVVKPSESAACAYRDGFYVISVEEVNRMPPLEHHLENKVSVLKETSIRNNEPLQRELPASIPRSRHRQRLERRDDWEQLGKNHPKVRGRN